MTTISELIKELEQWQSQYGDLLVYIGYDSVVTWSSFDQITFAEAENGRPDRIVIWSED